MALPPSVAAPAAGPSSQAATSPLRAERAAAERDLAARHDSQSAPNVTVATGAVGGVAGGERRTNRGQRTGLENVAITAAGASGRGEGEGEGVGARREKAGAQRRAFGDVAGANASAGAVRGVGRVAVTVPDTVPPAPPAAALFDRNAEAVAGCYTVTSDRPIGLPSLLSLDTAVTGVGGFAGGLAGEPQARRAAPARARETAVRRLSVRDSARATLTAIPGGYWTEAIQGYPRIVILGTPPRVLQLRVEGAGMLRGTVESEAGITTVTLKRTDCR